MSMKSIGPARRSCSRPGKSGIPSTGGTSGALSTSATTSTRALTVGASRSAGRCDCRAMPPAPMTAPRYRRTSGDAGEGIALAGEHVAQGRGVPLVDPQQHHEQQAHPHRLDPERSEEHTSELQSHSDLVCRLLLEKKKKKIEKSRKGKNDD